MEDTELSDAEEAENFAAANFRTSGSSPAAAASGVIASGFGERRGTGSKCSSGRLLSWGSVSKRKNARYVLVTNDFFFVSYMVRFGAEKIHSQQSQVVNKAQQGQNANGRDFSSEGMIHYRWMDRYRLP